MHKNVEFGVGSVEEKGRCSKILIFVYQKVVPSGRNGGINARQMWEPVMLSQTKV